MPQSVAIRGPTAREVADRFADVQDWVRRWETGSRGLRLEYGTVGGRLVGVNRIPVRAAVEDEPQLWRLLSVGRDVAVFRGLLDVTETDLAELVGWVREHPLQALAAAPVWSQALEVVPWIVDHGGPSVYLRQVDVPGVDTKFVESNRALLSDLLDVVLPLDRVDASIPRTMFAARYGLATKPSYVRLRRLDGGALLDGWPAGLSGQGPSEVTLA